MARKRPTPPWRRPAGKATLCHGDQDTPRHTAPIPTPSRTGTRLGHFPADLPTTQANEHPTLPRGPASPGDVPGPGDSVRSDGVRPSGLGRAQPTGLPQVRYPGSRLRSSKVCGLRATSGSSPSPVRRWECVHRVTRVAWPGSPPMSPITCCLTYRCASGSCLCPSA